MTNTPYDIKDKPCIICLEPDDTIDINELKPATALIKTCACKFYTHEKCIVKWITNNPTCPYCKQPLWFECCIIILDTNKAVASIAVADTVVVTDLDAQTNNNSLCITRCVLMTIVVIILMILLDKILLT